MNLEKDIFKRTTINFKKLIEYGFKIEKDKYIYQKNFLNNDFQAIITIDNNENISSKIIDLQINEEYINIRTEMNGEFVNKVRESYKEILIDIKNKCTEINYFINNQTNRITKYINNKYLDKPEFLWPKFPGYGVFRNKNNNKWYGIIMNIDSSKLENTTGEVEIINIKLEEEKIKKLLKIKGFYKAYHMNKKDWISIILNDTLKDNEINSLIDESYNLINEPEQWIIPANSKYYDIINCFNNTNEIEWKQSSKININDIIYIYVASPYSKIIYKCKATEVNIPYSYKDKNLTINTVMKIKLLKKIDNKNYTFEYLQKLGIKWIRGPIKISKNISSSLK